MQRLFDDRNGDVIEPDDQVICYWIRGGFALAAAKGMLAVSQEEKDVGLSLNVLLKLLLIFVYIRIIKLLWKH